VHNKLDLTEEGRSYLGTGSPEFQVFQAVPFDGGISQADLKANLGPVADHGFRQAMQLKWVRIDKSSGTAMVVRATASVEDKVLLLLKALAAGNESGASSADLQQLTKRRLVLTEGFEN